MTQTVTIDGNKYKVTPQLTQLCASRLAELDNGVDTIRIDSETELTLIMKDGVEESFKTADFLKRAVDQGHLDEVQSIIDDCGLYPQE